jgi:hypothetical protein
MKEFISNIMKYVLGIYGNVTKNMYVPPAPPPVVTPAIAIKKPSKLQFDFDSLQSKAWEGIVLHHSATIDGVTRDTEGIIKFHTSYRIDYKVVTQEEFERRQAIGDGRVFEKPWKAVGYHFLIEYVGKELTLNYGRPLWMVGAHAGHPISNKYNQDYIGICVIGNFDETIPPKETINYTVAVCKSLMKTFGIKKENILGHRETFVKLGVPVQKQCPGKNWDMDEFRAYL